MSQKVGPFSRAEAKTAIKFVRGIQTRLDRAARNSNIPAMNAFCLSQEIRNVGLIIQFIEELLNEPKKGN